MILIGTIKKKILVEHEKLDQSEVHFGLVFFERKYYFNGMFFLNPMFSDIIDCRCCSGKPL